MTSGAVTVDEEWTDLVGPFTNSQGVEEFLHVTGEQVAQRVAERSLLGLRLGSEGEGEWVFPTWQFESSIFGYLPAVLAAAGYAPKRPATQWTIAAWLTQSNVELGGASPLDLLRENDVGPVELLASEVAESLDSREWSDNP